MYCFTCVPHLWPPLAAGIAAREDPDGQTYVGSPFLHRRVQPPLDPLIFLRADLDTATDSASSLPIVYGENAHPTLAAHLDRVSRLAEEVEPPPPIRTLRWVELQPWGLQPTGRPTDTLALLHVRLRTTDWRTRAELATLPDWRSDLDCSRRAWQPTISPYVSSPNLPQLLAHERANLRAFKVAANPTPNNEYELLLVLAAGACLVLVGEPPGTRLLRLDWEPAGLRYNVIGTLGFDTGDPLKLQEMGL